MPAARLDAEVADALRRELRWLEARAQVERDAVDAEGMTIPGSSGNLVLNPRFRAYQAILAALARIGAALRGSAAAPEKDAREELLD